MWFLLYGQDTYRSRAKLAEIVDQFQKKAPFALAWPARLDFKRDSFEVFLSLLRHASLFSAKKLVVLEGVFSPPLNRQMLDFLRQARAKSRSFPGTGNEATLVFFEEGAPNAKDPLFVFLKKEARTQEFAPLTGPHLIDWARQEFRRWGAKISDETLRKLCAAAGPDLWPLENEIQKLVARKKGEPIVSTDLEQRERTQSALTAFQMLTSLAAGQKALALKQCRDLLANGASPFYLLAMLHYYWRRKLLSATERGYLKKIYRELLKMDGEIKSGKISPRQGLEMLVERSASY